MFASSKSLAKPSLILVGVLLDDLNRSILQFRSFQKPFFTLQNGALTLSPGRLDSEAALHPRFASPIPSYLLPYLVRTQVAPRIPFLRDYLDKRALKEALNEKLIQRFDGETRREGLPMAFVIFYECGELERTTWREEFLKRLLTEKRIPFLDTKPALRAYSQSHQIALSTLYKPEDGHHNNLGNEVIATALREFLLQAGLL